MKESWCFILILNKSKDTEPSYPEFSEAPPALQNSLTIALSAAWFVFEGFNSTMAKLLSLCLKLQNQWSSWMIHTFRTLQQLCSQERLSVFPIRCQGISRLKAWEDPYFASTEDHTFILKITNMFYFYLSPKFHLMWLTFKVGFTEFLQYFMWMHNVFIIFNTYEEFRLSSHWKSEVGATVSHITFNLPFDHWTWGSSLSISIQTCIGRILKTWLRGVTCWLHFLPSLGHVPLFPSIHKEAGFQSSGKRPQWSLAQVKWPQG